MTFYEKALQALEGQGNRITNSRKLVLSAFDKSVKPLSAYQLKELSDKAGHKIDVVTVYRIIEYLEKLGLIHKVHSNGGYVKCTLDDPDAIHSFFECHRCGKVQEFSGGDFDSFKGTVEKGYKFKIKNCALELKGYCQDCKKWY